MDTETPVPVPKQLCVACRTAIEPGATICPTCKLWQTPWKNLATYVAGFVTALALILSGITYVDKNFYELFHQIDDAEVLEFSHPGNQVYSNPGTSDIFLSRVETDWQGGNTSLQLDIQLNHGSIYVRQETDEKIAGHRLAVSPTGDGIPLLSRMECFQWWILSRDHFAIKQMNRHYEQQNLKVAVVNTETRHLRGLGCPVDPLAVNRGVGSDVVDGGLCPALRRRAFVSRLQAAAPATHLAAGNASSADLRSLG